MGKLQVEWTCVKYHNYDKIFDIKRQEMNMAATRVIDSDIRPISDLRNKFAEIADYVQGGNTVIFTRNGYGCMVTMSFETYKHLNDPVIPELNQVDALCENDPRHYTRAESLKILKERRDARRKVHA